MVITKLFVILGFSSVQIDRLYGWQTAPHSDVANVLKKQKANTKIEFEERMQLVKVQFAEQVFLQSSTRDDEVVDYFTTRG